jgi:hypothetical protein
MRSLRLEQSLRGERNVHNFLRYCRSNVTENVPSYFAHVHGVTYIIVIITATTDIAEVVADVIAVVYAWSSCAHCLA